MRYEYIAVYKVAGISWSSEQPDKEIANLPEYEATAILTANLEKYCFNTDRGRAISALMLSGLLGTSSEGDFEARLEKQLTTIRGQRERVGKGAFLVYRGAGEKDNFDGEDVIDFGEFGFYFSDSEGSPVKERFQNSVNGVLAALSLSLDVGISPRIDKVTEYSYFVDSNCRIIYRYQPSMTVTAALARPLTEQTEQFVDRYSQKLGRDKQLLRIVELLTQSLQGSDNLRAFLSAWTGLEIFVNKMFNV